MFDLTPDSALRLHLAKAREFWREDRLELANAAMQNALHVGLPPGDWYDLQRTIEAELGARRISRFYRLAEHLTLEVEPHRWGNAWEGIRQTAPRVCEEVTEALGICWGKLILVTLIPEEDWLAFMHTRYGYYAERTEWHKICLPPSAIRTQRLFRRALLHEMAHAGVHQLASEGVPRWLDEGIAVVLEGGSPPGEQRQYHSSLRKGLQLTLEEVSSGFESFEVPIDSPRSALSYAAAGDFVGHLVNAQGFGSLRNLLRRIGRGERSDRAFRTAFGVPLPRAEREWLSSIGSLTDRAE